MNRTLNEHSGVTSGVAEESRGYRPSGAISNGSVDHPLLEVVAATGGMLESIESRLYRLEGVLFGSIPQDESFNCEKDGIPNVKRFAEKSFDTTTRIQSILDSVISRIESN